MGVNGYISECTAYDFKLMLEEKESESRINILSAFAKGFRDPLLLTDFNVS